MGGLDSLPAMYADVVRGELNVKEVHFGAAADEYIDYIVKPQLRTLGPKYGKALGAIRKHFAEVSGREIVRVVRSGAKYCFDANGQPVELEESDLLIEPVQKEGFAVEVEGDLAVIIDTHLTPELEEEGNVREIVSKVQTMRKEAGFEVTDHIRIFVAEGAEVEAIAARNAGSIAADTLAESVETGRLAGYTKQWDINGKQAVFGVEKVEA